MSAGLLAAAPGVSPWFDRVDARLRLLGALWFALVVVGLQQWPVLLLALALAAGLGLAAGLDPRAGAVVSQIRPICLLGWPL